MREAWDLGEVHEGKVWDVWSGGIPSENPPFPSSLQHLLIQQGEFLYKWPASAAPHFSVSTLAWPWLFESFSSCHSYGEAQPERVEVQNQDTARNISSGYLRFRSLVCAHEHLNWQKCSPQTACERVLLVTLLSLIITPLTCSLHLFVQTEPWFSPLPSDRHVNLWCSVSLYRNFSLSRLEILFLEIVQQEVAINLIFIFFFLFF